MRQVTQHLKGIAGGGNVWHFRQFTATRSRFRGCSRVQWPCDHNFPARPSRDRRALIRGCRRGRAPRCRRRTHSRSTRRHVGQPRDHRGTRGRCRAALRHLHRLRRACQQADSGHLTSAAAAIARAQPRGGVGAGGRDRGHPITNAAATFDAGDGQNRRSSSRCRNLRRSPQRRDHARRL